MSLRVGIVGFGKIARDAHAPSIAATEGVELVAAASRNAKAEGVANYRDIASMLSGEKDIDAVILCQPPQARYDAACAALRAGKHVFLEKPPGATVSEVEALVALAAQSGVTLFASWHSRFAAGVARARAWARGRTLKQIVINWKEDVRHWHPGQQWIWEPGGFGVFDPGINALSILTHVAPHPVRLLDAELETPANRQAPIAARLDLATGDTPISAAFDWRQTGPQTWDILIRAEDGELLLSEGGQRLFVDGAEQDVGRAGEYPSMYRHFVDLVRAKQSDVDTAPLKIVADAFLRGRTRQSDRFDD